jgi:hypothetical protein
LVQNTVQLIERADRHDFAVNIFVTVKLKIPKDLVGLADCTKRVTAFF